ncbi:MAG: ABC transporter permease [Candidatus Methanoplasma sp.]|nr:ABC transporter permease [Candidatus Methanoplasma sp.]
MPRIIDEPYRVAWGDLCFFKDNFAEVLISCLVGPLLYLVAFGYGIGSNMQDGVDEYMRFMIPGIISMATLSATFNFVSTKIMVQKLFYSSFDELLLCPIKPSSVVLGKALVGVLRGMCSCTIILAIGALISPGFSITPFLIVLIILSSFTFSLLGITAALVIKRHNSLVVFTSLVIVPMTFFCGTIFNTSNIPQALGSAIFMLPLTHPTAAIRASMLDEAMPWLSVIILCGYCALFFMLDYYLIKSGKY